MYGEETPPSGHRVVSSRELRPSNSRYIPLFVRNRAELSVMMHACCVCIGSLVLSGLSSDWRCSLMPQRG